MIFIVIALGIMLIVGLTNSVFQALNIMIKIIISGVAGYVIQYLIYQILG